MWPALLADGTHLGQRLHADVHAQWLGTNVREGRGQHGGKSSAPPPGARNGGAGPNADDAHKLGVRQQESSGSRRSSVSRDGGLQAHIALQAAAEGHTEEPTLGVHTAPCPNGTVFLKCQDKIISGSRC